MSATPAGPATRPGVTAPAVARAGAVVAGAGHLLAALDHLSHNPGFFGFFLAVGLAQLGGAPALRPGARPALVTTGLAATVALLVLYLVSRTVALELGPHADRPEAADLLGTVVVLAELATLAAAPALLPPRWRATAVNAILGVGAAVWIAWFAGLLG